MSVQPSKDLNSQEYTNAAEHMTPEQRQVFQDMVVEALDESINYDRLPEADREQALEYLARQQASDNSHGAQQETRIFVPFSEIACWAGFFSFGSGY